MRFCCRSVCVLAWAVFGRVGHMRGSRLHVPLAQGVCTLHYKGPVAIAYGLRAALRDKFPDLVEVLMIDPETEEPIKFQ